MSIVQKKIDISLKIKSAFVNVSQNFVFLINIFYSKSTKLKVYVLFGAVVRENLILRLDILIHLRMMQRLMTFSK